MPNFGLLSSSITVNGQALEEFDVTERDNVYSCWIASQEGINFQVHCKVEPSLESYSSHVYVDGTYMDGAVFYPRTIAREHSVQGCPISEDRVKLFAFSKISLTDDDSVASADRQLTNLGTIEVKFRRVEVTGLGNMDYRERDLSSNSVIHERSKKMGMHHVALQGTGTYQVRQAVSVHYLDKAPFATFAFRYRPREFLCAQGIIPTPNNQSNATASQSSPKLERLPDNARQQERKRKRNQRSPVSVGPSNTMNNEAVDDSGDEEIRQLKKTMHDMQARLSALEHRKGGNVKKEIKRELAMVQSRSFKLPPMDANGVIDLTED